MLSLRALLPAVLLFNPAAALAAETVSPTEPKLEISRPIDGIRDNSFLVEEAYNQEKGVVQHIFTGRLAIDDQGADRKRAWELAFSQEWPVFSQRHQFSYSIPYNVQNFYTDGQEVDHIHGIGDITLSYRYQAFDDKEGSVAFAPRFTLILPTGNSKLVLGNDVVGYQWNLPVSKTLTDRAYVNFNAGFTYLPDTHSFQSTGTFSADADLFAFNLGASLMYAATDTFHFVLETVWNSVRELEEIEDLNGNSLGFSQPFYRNLVTILPGVRMAFNLPHDVQIVPGVGIPIGLTESAPDIGVFLYLSIEHPFMKTDG